MASKMDDGRSESLTFCVPLVSNLIELFSQIQTLFVHRRHGSLTPSGMEV